LHPSLKMEIYERLDVIAGESSDAWNNAGTGHSAFCELNYTPQDEAGDIDITKALKIAESFEVSKQFWAYLLEKGSLGEPKSFINATPHMSIVWDENLPYLKQRFEQLIQSPLFEGMVYSEDKEQLKQWIPLIMEGRASSQPVAVTRMELGTDMNFGALTRALFAHLETFADVRIHLSHEVHFIERRKVDGHWEVEVVDRASGQKRTIETKFLFIGAGAGPFLC